MAFSTLLWLLCGCIASGSVLYWIYSSNHVVKPLTAKAIEPQWQKRFIENIQREMDKCAKNMGIDKSTINSELSKIESVDFPALTDTSMPIPSLQTAIFRQSVNEFLSQKLKPSDPIMQTPSYSDVKLIPVFGSHNSDRNVIFSKHMSDNRGGLYDYKAFVGTLRQFGYIDDIVVTIATKNNAIRDSVYMYMKSKDVVVYSYPIECPVTPHHCSFSVDYKGVRPSGATKPQWVLEYELFEYWASLYSPSSTILILPLTRAVLFQVNPFPLLPTSKLSLFQSQHALKDVVTRGNTFMGTCGAVDIFDSAIKNKLIRGNVVAGPSALIRLYLRVLVETGAAFLCWSLHRDSILSIVSYLFYTGQFSRLLGGDRVDLVTDRSMTLHFLENNDRRSGYTFGTDGSLLEKQSGQKVAIVMNWLNIFGQYKDFVSNVTDLKDMLLNSHMGGSGDSSGNPEVKDARRVYNIKPPLYRNKTGNEPGVDEYRSSKDRVRAKFRKKFQDAAMKTHSVSIEDHAKAITQHLLN